VAGDTATPVVTARVSPKAERFFGAVPKDNAFVVLTGDTLRAFSVTGRKLWESESQWFKFSKGQAEGEPPCFNRPGPVALADSIAVLNCRDWRLALETFSLAGQRTATVRPVPHDMQNQVGLLDLGRAGDSLVFGYRLAEHLGAEPDKGVLVFDANLKKLYEHDAWGDSICCTRDGSVYARTGRPGKDLEWRRFTPDGKQNSLPKSVSRYTCVMQPGNDNEVILWGGRNNSAARRPDGSLDSIGLRRIWRPSQPEAQVIHEFWRSWQGHVVACEQGRYVLRIWPHSQQEFICVNLQGKRLWQHKLTLSRYFWPPMPFGDHNGNAYVMDVVQDKKTDMHSVVLKCLSPSGKKTWALAVDQTTGQPVFDSYLSESGSHVLLVRHDRQSSLGLIFIALPSTDKNGSNQAIDRDKK